MIQKKKNSNIVLVAGFSLSIGLLIGYLTGFRYGTKFRRQDSSPAISQQLPRQTSRLNLDTAALEVIKELNCLCGCNMELAPCTCDDALGSIEIKQFVQDLLSQGLSKSEAKKRLVEKYGDAVLIRKKT